MREGDVVRQGDVLIVKISEFPNDQEYIPVTPDRMGRNILAEGEATGHAHAVLAKDTKLFTSTVVSETVQNMILEVFNPSTVKHEEHNPIDLDNGIYKIIRQREFTPESIRNVAD
jgi:hypothetical protein